MKNKMNIKIHMKNIINNHSKDINLLHSFKGRRIKSTKKNNLTFKFHKIEQALFRHKQKYTIPNQ